MESFSELDLPESLRHTLEHMKFDTPTPVQAQSIPYALEGRDVLGSAQTGTGKTGAFGIPLVVKMLSSSRGTALVMTPTRELATQVLSQLQAMLGKHSPIKTALLIGGDSMPKQVQQLKRRPRILVGTPGRINDHLERGTLLLHDTNFLVLDETDRMLDMGFTIQIEKVMSFMPKTRQTMLFSATLPKNIASIANKYLTNPVRVAVSNTSEPAQNITHDVVRVADKEKAPQLIQELNAREGSVIIFVKTKHGAARMATKLTKMGHDADAIHGDLRQNKRDKVIANFRAKKYRILVATDVAARGLDIPHIEHVINYDLPQAPEDYIHRIGRTARAGAEGAAVCFVTPEDRSKWNAIDRLMNPQAKQERPSGGDGNKEGAKKSANKNRRGRRSNRDRNAAGEGTPKGPNSGGGKPRKAKPKSGRPEGARTDRPNFKGKRRTGRAPIRKAAA